MVSDPSDTLALFIFLVVSSSVSYLVGRTRAETIRVTGGGARSNFWTGMLGDLYGRPLRRMRVDEGPAFGAALLGGVAARVWPDIAAAVEACVAEAEAVPVHGDSLEAAYERYRSLFPVLRGHFS
ncbi:MAG: hypothetical protein C4320_10025 [Armatimonadota bacterium]